MKIQIGYVDPYNYLLLLLILTAYQRCGEANIEKFGPTAVNRHTSFEVIADQEHNQ